ncbi:MAG TPA: insulinase family protein, partial [Vicingus sp.]|nr:insulinase family protein [Vicingus sp.]
QPYGDVWSLLRPMVYQKHPYQWATIGKEIAHIENATMTDVKEFFFKHYLPCNAILSVAGNVTTDEIKALSEKWFGNIPSGEKPLRNIPLEPIQTEERRLRVERDVPANAIFKAFRMCKKTDEEFYATDLLSDILSNGSSARLYQALVKNNSLFSEISAYVMGSFDEGMFIISGNLQENTSFDEAEKAIEKELENIKKTLVAEHELTKVKNKIISSHEFAETSVLNKAMNLAIAELLGDANDVNFENEKYSKVTPEDINKVAKKILVSTNCSTLIYAKKTEVGSQKTEVKKQITNN